MDDVPVKIVERYKPPPPVYQLPQSTVNRLGLYKENYYEDQPDYQYDFQLERAVLGKAHRWQQLRQQQRQEREKRQDERKVARQRAVEAKQKEMLGAVDYPSADDLSSSDDEEKVEVLEDNEQQPTHQRHQPVPQPYESPGNDSHSHESKSIILCNFHNILQPTILSTAPVVIAQTLHKRNNSLNYADFEYNMNSTPFDNIELKTINDLDVLAQVLHQTKLQEQNEQRQLQLQVEQVEKGEQDLQKEEQDQTQEPKTMRTSAELTVTTLAETKATLDSVNFHVHCDDDYAHKHEDSNIPANGRDQAQTVITSLYQTPLYGGSQQQQQIQSQPQQPQEQEHFQVYHMQGYSNSYSYHQQQPQQQQQQHQVYNNQNNYYANGFGTPKHVMPSPSVVALSQAEAEAATKSKSVPDILRELKTELQQAEKRRTRLHSHNEDQQQQHQKPHLPLSVPQRMEQNAFGELAGPAQKLVKRISGMGFPLERVAKVVSLCGIDDKKIIEHLIPLGELMDLGFDETKISAALIKFDNNKDKALDYLIN
ncbi:putative cyclin-dependent serine/threonine-protein kinase [Drosophila madeirensis]|uniref:Cyclin-dependent serine/threonine-protein kinase n=1 Tax=Drosophila madeirensis TaxID=30013 RepID=A0AAU9EQR0_DROMD